jgi:hypothetical protein
MDPAVDRTHYAVDIRVFTKDGKTHLGQTDVPPGTPAKPMTDGQHRQRLYDCAVFSGKQWFKGREEAILDYVGSLEEKEDVGGLINLFLP